MRAATLAVVLMTACGLEPENDENAVNFGLVVDYAERKDLSAPIAVGAKMPIGVQNGVKTSLVGDHQYVDGTLEVKDASGNVLPMRQTWTGQFETVFPSAGRYSLTANTGRAEKTIEVTAKEVASLKLLSLRVTTTTADNRTCSAAVAPAPLVLFANQDVDLVVGAFSADGESLLGVPDFDVLDLGVDVNRPIIFPTANAYIVSPRAEGEGSVTFTERTSGAVLKLGFTHDAAMARCP